MWDKKTILGAAATALTFGMGVIASVFTGKWAGEQCEDSTAAALPTSIINDPFETTANVGGYVVNVKFPSTEIPINQTTLEGIIRTAGNACEYDVTTKLALLTLIATVFGGLLTYQYYQNNQLKLAIKKQNRQSTARDEETLGLDEDDDHISLHTPKHRSESCEDPKRLLAV